MVLGGVYFSTKAAAMQRAQNILHGTPHYVALEGDDTLFVRDMLDLHPCASEKIGVGVSYIDVVPTAYRQEGFRVVRVDGTSDTFSYRICLKLKPSSPAGAPHWTMVAETFREAVRDQTFAVRDAAFAQTPVLVCPITGDEFGEYDSAVDHIAPDTFDSLLRRFLEQEGLDGSQAITDRINGSIFRRIKDPSVHVRWRAWHQKHARLRVLSKRGNLLVAAHPEMDVQTS
jgi:hypothetical protein